VSRQRRLQRLKRQPHPPLEDRAAALLRPGSACRCTSVTPPGTSKWNKIEHRLFSIITQNWRGKPLISHEMIINLIAATKTRTFGSVDREGGSVAPLWRVLERFWLARMAALPQIDAQIDARVRAHVAIPDFQSIMRPLLAVLADRGDETTETIRASLAEKFTLTEEDLEERLPSGRTRTWTNRVAWALSHLKSAVAIESPRRGVYRITDRGRQVLADTPETERVDIRTLSAFDEYQYGSAPRRTTAGPRSTPLEPVEATAGTPTERMESAFRELRAALAADVLDRVREQTPAFFEQVVLDVLQAIGYGGSREDAAQRLGRGGDGGVDGVIREDKLGLDLIYVQAKRWTNTVGRPEIQQFVGALNGQRASKGVFITTSNFSREALGYADAANPRVILVDGKQLAELMIDHGVGVSVETTYRIRRVDLDYFGEDGSLETTSAEGPGGSTCRPSA